MSSVHTVFAHTNGLSHMDGFDWGMMGVGWLSMLMIAGLVSWILVRTMSGSTTTDRDPMSFPQRILAERFARGEIDDQEYRRRSAELIG